MRLPGGYRHDARRQRGGDASCVLHLDARHGLSDIVHADLHLVEVVDVLGELLPDLLELRHRGVARREGVVQLGLRLGHLAAQVAQHRADRVVQVLELKAIRIEGD